MDRFDFSESLPRLIISGADGSDSLPQTLVVATLPRSRQHYQAAHGEGLTRRGPPTNKLSVTDCVDALESALLYSGSHYDVLFHQGLGKRLFSSSMDGQAHGKDLILTGDRVDPRPLRGNQAIVIFVVGGPGVGKNSLGKELASKYNFVLVSISAILREEIARGTERGHLYKSFMEKGDLLPAVMVVQLVRKMLAYPDANGYLIIGFPRDKKQAMITDAVLFNTEVKPPELIINLYARKSILQKRLAQRSLETLRFDDTEEAIRNRITNYFVNPKGAIAPNRVVMKMVDAEASLI
ncbi:Adenylate kinase isoenzyme 1 [Melipona quadrifasciata]|uniref:Adenylate kinase isoenzyme 1 n=1 Tax=Melipona quadrifasciata TaxID=166423 RepID=A0A0M9A7B6_9HYME|nr:Adenylate kinase isoenzyme 1 [Melipona quadrifasciata]